MIDVRCLGHSGLDLNFGGTRIVCDPWLSPYAYLGGWQPFPDNSNIAPASLYDAPYLYISHLHADHFDVHTLRPYPKSVRVLIPKFPTDALRRELVALGFQNVTELNEWEPLELAGGVTVRMLMDPTRYILDSCLVVEHGGQVVINQNDCFLDAERQDRLAAMRPVLHINQFSGASYYPAIYAFPPEQMRSHVEQYKSLLYGRFSDGCRRVGARYIVPSAGPPCFMDDPNYELNFGGSIFYKSEELLRMLEADAPAVSSRIHTMHPGDVAHIDDEGVGRFESTPPYADIRSYIDSYRKRRAPVIAAYRERLRAEAGPVSFAEMRTYFMEFFKYYDFTRGMDLLVKVELTDGPSLYVDFRTRPVRYLAQCGDAPNYTLLLESAWMSHIIQRRTTWFDVLMSLQMRLKRDPDRYCVGLVNHLYYRDMPELLDLVRMQDMGDRFIKMRDGAFEYECQQACPHQGRNLSEGQLVDGVLTCPGHGWQFDLRDGGKCIKGGDQSVMVKSTRSLRAIS
jgi:UDP-MurNAc hydroxylase